MQGEQAKGLNLKQKMKQLSFQKITKIGGIGDHAGNKKKDSMKLEVN